MMRRFLQGYQVFHRAGIISTLNLLFSWVLCGVGQPTIDPEYSYAMFSKRTCVTQFQRMIQKCYSKIWKSPPHIAIVTIANSFEGLPETQQSITAQTYPYNQWYVCVPQNMPRAKELMPAVLIHVEALSKADCLNEVIHVVKEPLILLVEAGDTLAADALYRFAEHLRRNPDANVLYADMDYVSRSTGFRTPFFKPEWSPEMLLSVNYPQYPMLFKKALAETCGGFNRAIDTACEWDFLLRVSEQTQKFQHIARVLYHHREVFPYSISQPTMVQQMLEQHLIRLNLPKPTVSFKTTDGETTVVPVCQWDIQKEKLISIIIPSKDKATLLAQCLSGIYASTTYPHFEVIVVDTGSIDAETHSLYEHYAHHKNFRVIRYTEKFNFSKACNHGAAYARGELYLFLNNDTEILQGSWLTDMAQWFERAEVGIVGCKLLHPSGTIQHGGIVVGIHGLADNFLAGEKDGIFTFLGSDLWYRNLLAVTGACLMISKQAYEQVKGFDEQYLLNFSDVQLCLDVYHAGYRVVYTPAVRLRHHESMTHRKRMPRADVALGLKKMHPILSKGDPYYNPNLSYRTPTPVLSRGTQDTVQCRNRFLRSSIFLWFDD